MLPSDNKQKKIFIGVSWPYASGNIHIGHLAGQYVVADIFARYNRMVGNHVLMVSGSDSHGAPVEFAAEEQKITPEELSNQSHEKIKKTYADLGFLYENYTSTTTENHKIVVQNIFKVLKEEGFLFTEKSKQYYDPKVERFLPDRYVRGTCPNCGATNARGDECPECGEFLNQEDLIDPYSTLSDAKPVFKETEHFYLDLSKVSPELKDWMTKQEKHWRKWVREFSKGWIKEGLKPRSVTRDLKFGIPVPLEGWENKVIYVWIEAVVGYLSAAIEWAEKQGNPSLWEDFWKDSACLHYYFIAGGNVPFHTIIWPAELIAYNKKYDSEQVFNEYKLPGENLQTKLNLPFNVPANKILMYKGKKMSKGDKTGITLEHLLKTYSVDTIRYFFARYAPENHDREFIWKDFIDANNNELVANLGNFINRVLTFTYTRFEGEIPEGELSEEVEQNINKTFEVVGKEIENCEFVRALEGILELGKFANKYFNDQAPWENIKTNPTDAGNTIYNSIQLVNAFRKLIQPIMPEASFKLADILNIKEEYDPNVELKEKGRVETFVNTWLFTELLAGEKIDKPVILFEKLEYTEDLQQEDAQNMKEVAVSAGKDIHFTQAEELKSIPIIWQSFNNLTIKKKSNNVKRWIQKLTNETKLRYAAENWKETPDLKKYVELHDEYSNEKGLKSSSENLIESVLKKGNIPNINTFVDIYNTVSALTGITIGAHDISKISGSVKFELLKEDKEFEMIGSKEKGIAYTGEYAYTDDMGIICRLDIKQSDRTKITYKTKDALIIMQGNESLQKADLERAMKLLEEGLKLLDN